MAKFPPEKGHISHSTLASCVGRWGPQKGLKPHRAWGKGAHVVSLAQDPHCCCRDTCARCPEQLRAPAGKGSLLCHESSLCLLRASWEMSVLYLAYLCKTGTFTLCLHSEWPFLTPLPWPPGHQSSKQPLSKNQI